MAPPIRRIKSWNIDDYSQIIDVRAPSEFADDHIPGAINLPVLDDSERAEIGTLHKQVGPFEAKRRGAALVARNIAHHLETVLAEAPRDFHPLVYCWRGGQRSGAMARILSEIGWSVDVIEGGYKLYRKSVLDMLDERPPILNIVILRGRTGTAKTHILRVAAAGGAQIIDLERLARHRGSLLGPEPGTQQPSQRGFESDLAACLGRCDPSRPVFIEAESNKIGDLHVPRVLWQQMRNADCVRVEAPLAERIAFLLEDYRHIIDHPDRLDPLLNWVASRIGHDAVNRWRDLVAQGDWTGFVHAVLTDHYDPAYDRSAKGRQQTERQVIETTRLDAEGVACLAAKLVEMG